MLVFVGNLPLVNAQAFGFVRVLPCIPGVSKVTSFEFKVVRNIF